MDHSSINRWVIKYAPLLEKAFQKRQKRPVGVSWRMDETYLKVKGQWVYLYRAVDKEGDTVDVCCLKNEMNRQPEHFLRKQSIRVAFQAR